jgi:DNA anti-recombination protein RmuC
LQNFSNLRAMRTVTPGRIQIVTQKELSAVVAECAARTERAEASIRESVARAEAVRVGAEASRAFHEKALDAVRVKQEEAVARQEAATAKLEEQRIEADARWQEERVAMRESGERQEKMVQEYARRTDRIVAEFEDARDERRAMLEALFRVMDRLPPPPPDLHSA